MKATNLMASVVMVSMMAAVSVHGKCLLVAGQDSSVIIVDDIRMEATRYSIDSATRTATVVLSLTSMKENPRELKINVYGTQLVDNERKAYYFSTITLGRVLMRFEDRQNYLHYLLQHETPVELTITAENISNEATAIEVAKIVFEDSEQEGRFLEAYPTRPLAP